MRSLYGFAFGITVAVFLGGYIYIRLQKPASCFDRVQNQDEAGVDCGGVCALACTKTIHPLTTEWALPFKVSLGWWSTLAYVQNPNFGVYAEDVPYLFTLYDVEGNVIAKKEGRTFIRDEATIPIFLGRIATPNQKDIARVSFSWLSDPVWKQVRAPYTVRAEQVQEVPTTQGSEISALIRNMEPVALRSVDVVVVVYGTGQNALAVSETFIDALPAYGSRRVSFVWPEPFSASVGRIEVFPRVSPSQ